MPLDQIPSVFSQDFLYIRVETKSATWDLPVRANRSSHSGAGDRNEPQFPGMILVAHRSMGGVSAHCDRKMTAGRNDG